MIYILGVLGLVPLLDVSLLRLRLLNFVRAERIRVFSYRFDTARALLTKTRWQPDRKYYEQYGLIQITPHPDARFSKMVKIY